MYPRDAAPGSTGCNDHNSDAFVRAVHQAGRGLERMGRNRDPVHKYHRPHLRAVSVSLRGRGRTH